jgi:hypothetical protein
MVSKRSDMWRGKLDLSDKHVPAATAVTAKPATVSEASATLIPHPSIDIAHHDFFM